VRFTDAASALGGITLKRFKMASQFLRQRTWLVILSFGLIPGVIAATPPCAVCHKEIAAQQSRTAMANTWQPARTTWLNPGFEATSDGYEIKRDRGKLIVSVDNRAWPVDFLMGGSRHGLGFLFYVDQIDGLPLARRALIQARYAWSPEHKELLLAPGASAGQPAPLEAQLGVVLSPMFERRCLACHGQPQNAAGGVHCDACHDSAAPHVTGAMKSMDICARCHVGLTRFADPSPEDLLIANQVQALKNSECYLQSGKAFSCTTCHDPHNDDAADNRRAEKVCLGCHAQGVASHASGGCVGCHMPAVEQGPLHLVDHWIRVHPGDKAGPVIRSRVRPQSEFLRTITTNNSDAADSAGQRLSNGESFYQVARDVSVDVAAPIGGYMGRKSLADLDAEIANAAADLDYGETSKAVKSKGRWIILQRLPRDFRWQAQQRETLAENLAARGEMAAAIEKAQEALKINPQFLRALNFIGTAFARGGNLNKAAQVLKLAAKLYPDDAATEFALASVLPGAGALEHFQRVIQLEPDFTTAYISLGMIYNNSGDLARAITTFRQGLQIDPLSAELNADLARALNSSGQSTEGRKAAELSNVLRTPK
jgi:predicted CXXCH cytochrome family protein